jgi:hypothetical protein
MLSRKILGTSSLKKKRRGAFLSFYIGVEILILIFTAAIIFLGFISNLVVRSFDSTDTELAEPGAQLSQLLIAVTLLISFIAIWRLKRWGVALLIVLVIITTLINLTNLLSGMRNNYVWIGLGFAIARTLVIIFAIKPKWQYFEKGFL